MAEGMGEAGETRLFSTNKAGFEHPLATGEHSSDLLVVCIRFALVGVNGEWRRGGLSPNRQTPKRASPDFSVFCCAVEGSSFCRQSANVEQL